MIAYLGAKALSDAIENLLRISPWTGLIACLIAATIERPFYKRAGITPQTMWWSIRANFLSWFGAWGAIWGLAQLLTALHFGGDTGRVILLSSPVLIIFIDVVIEGLFLSWRLRPRAHFLQRLVTANILSFVLCTLGVIALQTAQDSVGDHWLRFVTTEEAFFAIANPVAFLFVLAAFIVPAVSRRYSRQTNQASPNQRPVLSRLFIACAWIAGICAMAVLLPIGPGSERLIGFRYTQIVDNAETVCPDRVASQIDNEITLTTGEKILVPDVDPAQLAKDLSESERHVLIDRQHKFLCLRRRCGWCGNSFIHDQVITVPLIAHDTLHTYASDPTYPIVINSDGQ